uniref:Uncharacterized protein n=1 Tax=Oryza brachyantha TaxID=4533 RepID=J3L391_ORYBR
VVHVRLETVPGVHLLPVPAILLGELLRLADHPVDILWLSFRSSPEMVIFSDLPVAMSAACTLRMPLGSTSKVTSICGVPLGAGAMPVVNTCFFLVGTTVLRGISLVITPGRLQAEGERRDVEEDHA